MTARFLTALLLVASACAGEPPFSQYARDNHLADLRVATARAGAIAPGPRNGTRQPLVLMVTPSAPGPRKLVAYDLTARRALWTVEADVSSRLAIDDAIYHRQGQDMLVARDARSGSVRWSVPLPSGRFLGLAAGGGRVFAVARREREGRRTSEIRAWEGATGRLLWSDEAEGSLGAPAAAGGLVAVPHLVQNLTFLDAATGQEVARVRSTEEALGFATAQPEGLFYGGFGVYRLDEQSVSGTRAGSSYAVAKLPAELRRAGYWWDAYNAAQADFSAFDRNRLLWRGRAEGAGFAGDLVVLHLYRFLFGVDAGTGGLRWAYDHPRVDLVASAHAGSTILLVSADGEVVGLDAQTGAPTFTVATGERLAGATFDADGFAPTGAAPAAPPPLPELLVRIIWDPDRRFALVKSFAIGALAELPGADVARQLVKVITHEGISTQVYQRAAEALLARREAGAAAPVLEALAVREDFADDTRTRGVEVLARAAAAFGIREAVPALLAHLEHPATPLPVVREVATALGALGRPEAVPALRNFLFLYRADPVFGGDPTPLEAVGRALLALGGVPERQALLYVAEHPRTVEKLRKSLANLLVGAPAVGPAPAAAVGSASGPAAGVR